MSKRKKPSGIMPKGLKIKAKSDGQQIFLDSLNDDEVNYTVVLAPAGTGKTFLSCYHSAQQLLESKINKVYIARPPITVRGFDIGHLPGMEKEKYEPFVLPMIENFRKFIPEFDRYSNRIEILSLAHIRGRSLENCVVLVDEAQLLSKDILKSIFTRISSSSKLVLMGDAKQSDLTKGVTDIEIVCDALEGLDCFELVTMDERDQVRNSNITEILKRFESLE